MKILQTASAGTTDKNDCLVTVEKGNGKTEIHLTSKVIYEYGERIMAVAERTLQKLDVSDATVTIEDMGAFDHIIEARIEAALFRSADMTENIPWGELLHE